MVSRLLIPAMIAAALSMSAVAQAQGFPGSQWAPSEDRNDRDRDRGRQDQGAQEVPLGTILRGLRSQYGGQHLDAQKFGDRYRISWITDDGRRLTIEVDARTGRTLSVRG